MDKVFKLDKPKTSKRNNKVNPWITEGIKSSVKTKQKLYKQWAKTKSAKNPNGDVRRTPARKIP